MLSSGRHVAPENIIGKSKLMTNRSTVVPYSTDGSPDSCLSCTRLLANCLCRSILFFVFRTLSFMMFFHVVQSSTVQIDLVWFEVILSDVRLLIPRCILHFGLLGRNYSFSSFQIDSMLQKIQYVYSQIKSHRERAVDFYSSFSDASETVMIYVGFHNL